ncbi:hypothetical protein [uncultured Paraglaciecola sp.]|uniref:hypothetical protein n=1 Tax=uncultured Paraglaciecola sp. TaxID=1765024 RepID=UPI0026013568|nr:hypothetical protein [uncultured Paraglaciecola sp.]
MRELNRNEMAEVNGGDDSLIIAGLTITGISVGMTAFAVGSALFAIGAGAYAVTNATGLGNYIGEELYDALNDKKDN